MLLYFAIFRLDGSDNKMHFKMKEINSISRMMQLFKYLQKEHWTKFNKLT